MGRRRRFDLGVQSAHVSLKDFQLVHQFRELQHGHRSRASSLVQSRLGESRFQTPFSPSLRSERCLVEKLLRLRSGRLKAGQLGQRLKKSHDH